MLATFSHKKNELSNITTFYFAPLAAFHYIAGQFIELTVEHDSPDSRGQKRWFTLSSSPSSPLLSVTTRLSDDGSSFKHALSALQKGDTVTIGQPMGDFVLPKSTSTPLVFVAAGIGITPFLSILGWMDTHSEMRSIRLLYGVNAENEIIGQDVIDAAEVHATVVVAQPSDAWGGERGYLTPELIVGIEEPSPGTLVYLSGPENFVTALTGGLKLAGLNPNQLITDYFPGYDT